MLLHKVTIIQDSKKTVYKKENEIKMNAKRRLISILLLLCLIVSMLASMVPVSAVSYSDHVTTNNAEYTEDYVAPDIIDKDELETTDYVGRVPEDENDLYTFIFKNGDGSNTMRVFSHPVKYIDNEGATRDISLEISKSKDGMFTAADHMIKANFGSSITDGIGLEYNDIRVSMKVLDANENVNADLSDDGKKLTYAVDDKTSYVYSLTYLGIKEDIVVSEYTGQTEYEFSLFTNGLHPVKIDNSVFLSDVNGDIKASIGDIIIFTADERNNTFGNLHFETVTENEEYAFTIILDEDYLRNEKTAYPITIDPTIEINYDNNGAGAIEDVTINENVTFSGTSGSLYVGRHPAGSLSRTLMRFPNLSLSGISANQITAASVEIRDLICQGDEDITIDCCIYNNSSPAWTESGTTTWSSVGTSYVGTVLDSMLVSYGHGNVSAHRYGFNILNLAKAWANNTQSPSKGIVFKAEPAFENQTGSNIKTWYKTFASYNRASNKPSLTINYNESGFNNATTMSLGTYYSVSIVNSGEKQFYKYTPSTTGFYTFESSSIVSGDPYGRLYNNTQDVLASNDDSGSGTNFRITYHLMASCTYYFSAGCYSTGTGSYSVRLYKTSSASNIENPTTIAWGDTKSVSIAYSQASRYYKFTPAASGEYLFYSSDNTGDPRIWLYDSSLTLVGGDDDTAGNHNFRLVASLTAGQSYYISAGHFSTYTGTYVIKMMLSANIEDDLYSIQNIGSLKYVDIHGPGAQEWVHQWTYHTHAQEKWLIHKLADNYYTIKSNYGNNYYMGITGNTISTNNINLSSAISDYTKWKIYITPSEDYVFEPKNAKGRLLHSPNSNNDTELQLIYLSSHNAYSSWKPYDYKYTYGVSHFYDQGYSIRFSSINTNTVSLLDNYQNIVAERFTQIFSVSVEPSFELYTSPADTCKILQFGSVTWSHLASTCSHSPTHLTTTKLRDSLSNGTAINTVAIWTGHILDGNPASNSSFNRHSIVLTPKHTTNSDYSNKTEAIVKRESTFTLMHESSHQLGAPDHYCYGVGSSGKCSNTNCDICYLGMTSARNCLMSYRYDISTLSNDEIYCDDCIETINNHLSNHH